MMEGNIILAVDPSEQAEKAFDWYLEHLHKPGNSIIIVHCVDLQDIADQGDINQTSDQQTWDRLKAKVKSLEDKYQWKLNTEGITGKIRTESGKPGEVVIRVANEENGGLIVIGSRGLNKLRRTILGSVSEYVLHHAKCPVLICGTKPKDSKLQTRFDCGTKLKDPK